MPGNVDRHELWKAVITALTNDATVTSLIGNPVRVYKFTPPGAIFPIVVMELSPMPYEFAIFSTPASFARQHLLTLVTWSHKTSYDEAAGIHKAVADVMDDGVNNLTVANATVVKCIPGNEFDRFDTDSNSFMSVQEYIITMYAD